jgi:hypothetical protein
MKQLIKLIEEVKYEIQNEDIIRIQQDLSMMKSYSLNAWVLKSSREQERRKKILNLEYFINHT